MDVIEAVNPSLHCQEVIEGKLKAEPGLIDRAEEIGADTLAWMLADRLYGTLSIETRGRVSLIAFKTITHDVLLPIIEAREEAQMEEEENEERLNEAKEEIEEQLEDLFEQHGVKHEDRDVAELLMQLLVDQGLKLVRIKGGKWEVRKGRKRHRLVERFHGKSLAAFPKSIADAIAAAVAAKWMKLPVVDYHRMKSFWINADEGTSIEGKYTDDIYTDPLVEIDDVASDMGIYESRADTALEALARVHVRHAQSHRAWRLRKKRTKHLPDSVKNHRR